MPHQLLFRIIFPFTLVPTLFQTFSVPLGKRIQVRVGDFLGIHYPHDNRSAVPYRFGPVEATRHHKFTAFHEDLFVNYTVTPVYSTSTKRPAFKAYVKGTFIFRFRGHLSFWWLVRVTLVIDFLFLTQNFGPVAGTYEGLLQLCKCTLGGDCTSWWWGHLSTICGHQSFSRHWWWGP